MQNAFSTHNTRYEDKWRHCDNGLLSRLCALSLLSLSSLFLCGSLLASCWHELLSRLGALKQASFLFYMYVFRVFLSWRVQMLFGGVSGHRHCCCCRCCCSCFCCCCCCCRLQFNFSPAVVLNLNFKHFPFRPIFACSAVVAVVIVAVVVAWAFPALTLRRQFDAYEKPIGCVSRLAGPIVGQPFNR